MKTRLTSTIDEEKAEALRNDSLNYYITRNIRDFDFKNFILPVVTPTQFLKIFKQNS